MKLKEVLNLRKLKESFYDKGLKCTDCPFMTVCSMNDCIVSNIFNNTAFSDTIEDLYDMERNGTLTKDYQIEPVNTENF